MTLPWAPVVLVDIAGSAAMLLLACWCAGIAWQLIRKKPDDVFHNYIFLFTVAIAVFALSRSFGHLVKQLLILNDMAGTWKAISPFSGAVNSATFVVIFAFGLYFHRFQKVHVEIENYKNNLEEMIEKRTEELETSRHTLENILNNSNPLNITSVDFEILRANDAYYAIWPRRSKGDRRDRCYESRPGTYCNTDECPIRQIIAGKEFVSHEVSKEVNGKIREYIATARPFRDVDGRLIGMVESFQDITDIKQAERALIEADRMKSEFISLAAHELNTPLSVIMGYSEFLSDKKEFGSFSEEQTRDFLREIHDRGEALRHIIDDLLDISRIESGNPLPLDTRPHDLLEILASKVRVFQPFEKRRSVRLVLPESPKDSIVMVDRHRINQALDNLLSNAAKYSPEGTEITVSAREMADGWEIRIKDQGVGMTAEEVKRVFDKFYRANASNTAISGLGLGMSVTRNVVEAHGGTIRVESAKGSGTVVTITLPRSSGGSAPAPTLPVENPD